MLKDNIKDPTHYLVHELTHFLQQSTGNADDEPEEDYLEKETEEEAFETQIDYKKRNEGLGEANKYTEDLLDYHKYKGKERKEKKDELMEID
jgi:hypothetical protein